MIYRHIASAVAPPEYGMTTDMRRTEITNAIAEGLKKLPLDIEVWLYGSERNQRRHKTMKKLTDQERIAAVDKLVDNWLKEQKTING